MSYQDSAHNVIAVPTEKVKPNVYNPNKVVPLERRLLYESIKENGYTIPAVYYYAKAQDLYLIVDGSHHYQVMLDHPDIYGRERGLLSVSMINRPVNRRMTNTIRHNRARDTHNMDLIDNIMRELYKLERPDVWISGHLGMDGDETLRLKWIIRLATLFRDVEFDQAWHPVEDGQDWDDGRQVPWFVYIVRFVADK